MDRRSKKLLTLPIHVKYRLMYTHSLMSRLHTLSVAMKLWIVNVDTKTKVLLKFGSLETLCG